CSRASSHAARLPILRPGFVRLPIARNELRARDPKFLARAREAPASQAARVIGPGQEPQPEAVEPSERARAPYRRSAVGNALETVVAHEPAEPAGERPAGKGRPDTQPPHPPELGLRPQGFGEAA